MTRNQKQWLFAEAVLLCLVVTATAGLKMIMYPVLAQELGSRPLPWLTAKVLALGPLQPQTLVASLIFIMVTYLGLASLLKGQEQEAFLTHAPIVGILILFAYFIALSFAFVIPFISISGRLYLPGDPRPPGPIPAPIIKPWIWVIASIIYATVVGFKIRSQSRKGG